MLISRAVLLTPKMFWPPSELFLWPQWRLMGKWGSLLRVSAALRTAQENADHSRRQDQPAINTTPSQHYTTPSYQDWALYDCSCLSVWAEVPFRWASGREAPVEVQEWWKRFPSETLLYSSTPHQTNEPSCTPTPARLNTHTHTTHYTRFCWLWQNTVKTLHTKLYLA